MSCCFKHLHKDSQYLTNSKFLNRSHYYLQYQLHHILKDYTKGSNISNLRSIYHHERRDYDVVKMGLKQALEKRKTSS